MMTIICPKNLRMMPLCRGWYLSHFATGCLTEFLHLACFKIKDSFLIFISFFLSNEFLKCETLLDHLVQQWWLIRSFKSSSSSRLRRLMATCLRVNESLSASLSRCDQIPPLRWPSVRSFFPFTVASRVG